MRSLPLSPTANGDGRAAMLLPAWMQPVSSFLAACKVEAAYVESSSAISDAAFRAMRGR